MKNDTYILLIGAKSGIGRALAHQFAQKGYCMHLAGRNRELVEKEAEDIRIRYKLSVQAFDFDLLDTEKHQAFYESLKPWPEICIFVIGYLGDQKQAEQNPEEVQRILHTNFNAAVSFLDIVARDYEKRKQGIIIGISSVAGDRAKKSNYYYGAAKAALSAYLAGLRHRLYSSGVHVMTVKPGFVKTKMIEGMDTSPLLTARAEDVAKDVFRAMQKKKNTIYSKKKWRYIMWIIKSIPESLFKKTTL
jgi:decaprenylphospho-beta-D-erythro-pentofuranosid-2-ulose 2-reductase